MLFAFDYNDNRIHIDDTQSNKEYFCPYCGAPLVTKKGEVRQHHFAHKSNHLCSDSWEQTKSYDISPWHNEWQNLFPKENQEVKLSLGEITHRADVLIGRTVVEFQHSILSSKAFDERNNFYFNLNYKVVWLFDLSDIIQSGNLSYSALPDQLEFTWKNPKKAFNCYDVKSGCIDLFFQIFENDSGCIVRVSDVSNAGFEEFTTSKLMSKKDFLEYVGLVNDSCPEPDRTDFSINESYLNFKEKYQINLNKQQERTIQSIEGNVLLLAVPGSGKTTVLVDRLGYMVCEKHIDPRRILSITFNKNAAEEMKTRFINLFGSEYGEQIDFRTINSLSYYIYTSFCSDRNKELNRLIKDNEQKALHIKIYKEFFPDEHPSEGDITDLGTAIAYTKNMMLNGEEIRLIDNNYPKFSSMFNKYCAVLKKNNQMDYHDQMKFAHWILTHSKKHRLYWQNKYDYICVDEAQDTSKVQHEIIKILASGNNLFMVGDEDQSIYGFRAAYPKALLNFRSDYTNPFIQRMEVNYRSTPQIVEKAQKFISENKGRYEKNMVAARADGEPVELLKVYSVEEQYKRILEIAKKSSKETAFLYRDNESSVVLIDLFLRNNVQFTLKKPEMNFFGNSIVRDIVAYLRLSIDPYDSDSLKQICNKGILYLKKQQLNYAIKNIQNGRITVFDALEEQMKYLPVNKRDKADRLKTTIALLKGQKTEAAIQILLDYGYEYYIEKSHLDYSKIEILSILAKNEPRIQGFLNRLNELEHLIQQGFRGSENVILSTIHSSKGQEYDTVYMVDVYDGRFPSSEKNMFSRSKDNADGEQEERRLFYVGITRAKNKLYLFSIKNKTSSFLEALFPEATAKTISAKKQDFMNIYYENQRKIAYNRQLQEEKWLKEYELRKKQSFEEKQRCEEAKRINAEKVYAESYNEVKDKFTQQTAPIRDSHGVRWVKCEVCNRILPADKFCTYGGTNHVNLGMCNDCGRKNNN